MIYLPILGGGVAQIYSLSSEISFNASGTTYSQDVNNIESALLEAKGNERRSDWVDPYSYCATAINNSSESASVWKITRILSNNDGSVTSGVSTNVKWDDRLSPSTIYS